MVEISGRYLSCPNARGFHGLTYACCIGFAFAPAAASRAADSSVGVATDSLTEIVVTARKVAENLQDVPMSITALSAADLEARGITSVSNIFAAAPNVEFDSSGFLFNSQLTIRGVRSNDVYAGWETANGIILDDVYIGRSAAFNVDLLDVQQVEVLRGPQGTLQGKNIIGGAIAITSEPPSRTFGGAVTLDAGSSDLRAAHGYVTGPLSDTVAVKLSFTDREENGFTKNIYTGSWLGDTNNWGLRGQLLWTPTSQFRALVTIDGSHDQGTDNPSVYTAAGEITTPFTPTALSRVVDEDFDSRERRNIFGTTVKLTYDFSDALAFTSVSAYRSFNIDEINEQDGLPVVLVNSGVGQSQAQWSQEFRLTYKTSGVTAVGGLYYFRESLHDSTQIYENIPLIVGFPVAIPAFGLVPIDNIDNSDNIFSSYAAFGSLTKDVTERITLSGGVRVTHDDLSTRITDAQLIDPALGYPGTPPPGTAFPAGSTAVPIPVPYGDSSISNTEVTGDASLTYKFDQNVSGFIKYARGYKGGGFQTGLPTLPNVLGSKVAPEFVNDYELGFRSMFHEERIRFNVTAYHMDWLDRQSFEVNIVNGVPVELVYNDPKATINGFELEMDAKVTADLTLSVLAGSADTKFVKSNQASIQGDAFGQVSPYTVDLYANFVHPVSSGWNFRFVGDARWADRYPLRDDNLDPEFVQPSYWLVNSSIGLEQAGGRYAISAWGRNLTNENVIISAVPGVPSAGISPGMPGAARTNAVLRDPRTWGIQLTARF